MKENDSFIGSSVASLQWLVFLLANALALPVVIGQIYHLPPTEVADLMQRTFFVVGLASFLQGWLGHRLPMSDGPAGIWLGVFVMMGEMVTKEGSGFIHTLQLLEGGMIVTGLILVVCALVGWMNRIMIFFTPLVTGTYLMLLALQLSGVFLKGMIGVSNPDLPVDVKNAGIAFLIFALVFSLSTWGKGWLKSYAVLIGMMVGWILFVVFGWEVQPLLFTTLFQYPDLFAWGLPKFDIGMIVTAAMIALVLMSNTLASVAAMNQALFGKSEVDGRVFKQSGIVGGIANILSAVFSTVGMVPLSVAAGFVKMTGQKRIKPFLTACLLLVGISCVPLVSSALAQLPGPVAYAALLASFGQMFGLGLQSVLQYPLDQRRLTILGTTLSLGVGVMFLPPSVFVVLPSVLKNILGNGLLVGMIFSLILEQAWKEKKALTV